MAAGYDADFVGSYLISVGESADSVEGLKKIYVEPVKRPRILRGRGSGSAINTGNGVVGPAIAAARAAASSTPPAQSSVRVC